MAEAEFVYYLDIIDVEKYCKSSNAEERQNIICDKLSRLCAVSKVESISTTSFYECSNLLETMKTRILMF